MLHLGIRIKARKAVWLHLTALLKWLSDIGDYPRGSSIVDHRTAYIAER
jgi:hypothetical protein